MDKLKKEKTYFKLEECKSTKDIISFLKDLNVVSPLLEDIKIEKVDNTKGKIKVYTFPNMDFPRTREHIEERVQYGKNF